VWPPDFGDCFRGAEMVRGHRARLAIASSLTCLIWKRNDCRVVPGAQALLAFAQ